MSASLTQVIDGRVTPIDMVYLDAYAGVKTLTGVTLACTDPNEMIFAPAFMTAQFDADVFPLSGGDYLTPTTGTLTISVDTTGLSSGIILTPFYTLSGHWQGMGRMATSLAGFGVAMQVTTPVLPLFYVSIYSLNNMSTASPVIVPDSAWH